MNGPLVLLYGISRLIRQNLVQLMILEPFSIYIVWGFTLLWDYAWSSNIHLMRLYNVGKLSFTLSLFCTITVSCPFRSKERIHFVSIECVIFTFSKATVHKFLVSPRKEKETERKKNLFSPFLTKTCICCNPSAYGLLPANVHAFSQVRWNKQW